MVLWAALWGCASNTFDVPDLPAHGLRPCAESAVPIERTVRVRTLVGSDVNPAAPRRIAGRLERYFEPYGLELQWAPTPLVVPPDSMITGDPGHLRGLERDEAVERIYGNLQRFIETHAVPARDEVLIVVLREVADGSSFASQQVGRIHGMGLSPSLLEQEPLLPVSLGDFTPVMFIADSVERWMQDADADALIAHEFTHALGLPHSDKRGNLMQPATPGIKACLPMLDADQVAALNDHP